MSYRITRKLYGLACVAIPLLLLIVYLIIGFTGLYGQDAFEYLRYTHALGLFFREGIMPGSFPWPPVYPLAGALAGFIVPEATALQALSLAAYGVSIRLIYLILGLLYPENRSEARGYTLLFYALSPFVIRYSSTVMSDMPALCFALAGCYFTLLFRKTGEPRTFFLLSLFMFLSVNTRFSTAVILVIPGIYALLHFFRRFNFWYLMLSVAAAGVIFLPNILLGLNDPSAMQGQYQAMTWSPVNLFRHVFYNIDGISAYMLPNILFAFSNLVNPGFIFAGIAFLFLIFRKPVIPGHLFPWIAVFLVYSVFIAGFPLQNSRYLLFSFPIVIVLFFKPWLTFTTLAAIRKFLALITIAVVVVQAGLGFRAMLPFQENCRVTREVAREVLNYPGRKVYEFNIAMAFPAYGVTNSSVNLWSREIQTFDTGALVVFNLPETEIRWKGLNPMVNWNTLNMNYSLRLLHEMDKGWKIYEIRP